MPDKETVFTEADDNNDPVPTQEELATQEDVDKLKERGLDDLAKGKAHADRFITFLEEQNKGLKEELDKRLTAEQTLAEIKARGQERTEVSEENTNSGLKPEELDSLVDKRISESKRKDYATANIKEADAKIKEIYGDTADKFIKDKCIELGLTKADLGEVAAKSPRAFFDLVGVSTKKVEPSSDSSVSTVNPEALANNSSGAEATPGTNNWYRELRKKDKVKFYTPAVQQRLFKDRERLGEDFYK